MGRLAAGTLRPTLDSPSWIGRGLRSFLFLQGVCSPFFPRLAQALGQEGHSVRSVKFTVGDMLYGASGSLSYRGRHDGLVDFYSSTFRQHGITDVVLFGDCRPVHRPAIEQARRRGIRVHVFEEGYFRPYWITLERDGVNSLSRLPRDPDWYRQMGQQVPHYGNGEPFRQSFASRAWHDVVYHVGGALNPLLFPRYQTHSICSAPVEYLGYIRRGLRLRQAEAKAVACIEALVASKSPFFLLPLQLDGDAQIREHSRFDSMRDVLNLVLSSFARRAPGNTRLVVKNHPLSPGLVDYGRVTQQLAQQYGIAERVDYLESGHLPTLLDHASGTVTVNSTTGTSALIHRCPTLALGDPIYAMPGLTFQGSLDDFWQNPEAPDMELFRSFRNTVIHTTQVNGGFYTNDGIAMGVRNAVQVLLAPQTVLEQFL